MTRTSPHEKFNDSNSKEPDIETYVTERRPLIANEDGLSGKIWRKCNPCKSMASVPKAFNKPLLSDGKLAYLNFVFGVILQSNSRMKW
jgi:hypothetical protein